MSKEKSPMDAPKETPKNLHATREVRSARTLASIEAKKILSDRFQGKTVSELRNAAHLRKNEKNLTDEQKEARQAYGEYIKIRDEIFAEKISAKKTELDTSSATINQAVTLATNGNALDNGQLRPFNQDILGNVVTQKDDMGYYLRELHLPDGTLQYSRINEKGHLVASFTRTPDQKINSNAMAERTTEESNSNYFSKTNPDGSRQIVFYDPARNQTHVNYETADGSQSGGGTETGNTVAKYRAEGNPQVGVSSTIAEGDESVVLEARAGMREAVSGAVKLVRESLKDFFRNRGGEVMQSLETSSDVLEVAGATYRDRRRVAKNNLQNDLNAISNKASKAGAMTGAAVALVPVLVLAGAGAATGYALGETYRGVRNLAKETVLAGEFAIGHLSALPGDVSAELRHLRADYTEELLGAKKGLRRGFDAIRKAMDTIVSKFDASITSGENNITGLRQSAKSIQVAADAIRPKF